MFSSSRDSVIDQQVAEVVEAAAASGSAALSLKQGIHLPQLQFGGSRQDPASQAVARAVQAAEKAEADLAAAAAASAQQDSDDDELLGVVRDKHQQQQVSKQIKSSRHVPWWQQPDHGVAKSPALSRMGLAHQADADLTPQPTKQPEVVQAAEAAAQQAGPSVVPAASTNKGAGELDEVLEVRMCCVACCSCTVPCAISLHVCSCLSAPANTTHQAVPARIQAL